MMLMLNCLSIGFESNHALEKGQNNPRFLKQMAIQLILTIIYFTTSLFIDGFTGIRSGDNFVTPAWELVPAILVGLVLVGVIQYVVQRRVQKLYEKDQMQLETLYQTKLGMWSPK